MDSPTHTGAAGTRHEQPPDTAQPHMNPAPSPTGSPAPQPETKSGASIHGHQPAATQAAATLAHLEPRPGHGTPDRPTEGPAHAPPEDLPRTHVLLPRPTPPAPGAPTPCTPTTTTPPRARILRLRRRPAQQPRGTCRPRHKLNHRPSSTTPHQPDRRRMDGPQNRHLPVARPPTLTQVHTRHTPPSRLTPRGPQARAAGPSRSPCRKATPERLRDWQTTQPRHPQSHNKRSPRWMRRKWGDPQSKQQHRHQQGHLAGEWTSQQYSMPTHQAWRHTEAARHRPLANLVRNLKDQNRTTGMRPASNQLQPMEHNPQVARVAPPWRTRRIALTHARRGRRRNEAHLQPARSQRPGKPHPTRLNTRPAEKRCPANTTATSTLLMPSWSPA